MSALFSFEAFKLRTLRSTMMATGLGLVLAAVIGVAQAGSDRPAGSGRAVGLATVARGPAEALWFVAIVLAVITSAGEYQHRTICTTLLVAPRRGRVLLAKAAVAASYGAMLVATGAVVAIIAALATAARSGVSVDAGTPGGWFRFGATVGLGAVWAVLATGLGILTRSTAIAIGVVLLWRFVGEGLIPVVTGNAQLRRWMPSGLAQALVGGGHSPAPPAAAAILAAEVALLCGIAAVVFLRRDPC